MHECTKLLVSLQKCTQKANPEHERKTGQGEAARLPLTQRARKVKQIREERDKEEEEEGEVEEEDKNK